MDKKQILKKIFKYLEVNEDELKDYVNFSNLMLDERFLEEAESFSCEEPSVKILFLLSGFGYEELLEEVSDIIESDELDIDVNLDPEQFEDFSSIAIYSDWKVDLEQTLDDFQELLSLRELNLELDEDDFDENDNLTDWAEIFNNKLRDHGYSFVYFNADWDSYCYTIVKTKVVEKLCDEFNEIFYDYDMSASYLEASLSNNGINLREFECIDDTSNKFWNISWTNSTYTVHYGRIGAEGTKKESESFDVITDVTKLIKSKVSKGYVEKITKKIKLSYYDKEKIKITEFIKENKDKEIDYEVLNQFVCNDITYHRSKELTEDQINELSFKIYKFAHVYKHVRACYQYAYFTYHGFGTTKDENKAIDLLEVAANLGHTGAMGMYSANVFAGLGTNYELAMKFALAAGPKGYWTIAVQYLNGTYVKKDLNMAIKYADLCMQEKLSGSDALYTMTMQTKLLEDDLAYLESIKDITPTKEQLDKIATLALNYYYGLNNRVCYDDYPQEFMKYLLKHNHYEGKFMQGVCIERGYTKESTDNKLACKYVEEAAAAGSAAAHAMLAYYYENGVGCEIDDVKGYEASLKGAQGGNLHGYTNLGECYLTASGVEEDLVLAEKYLRLAASNGFDSFSTLNMLNTKLNKTVNIINNTIIDEGNVYLLDEEVLCLTSVSKEHKKIIIPYEIGGYKVKTIQDNAFSNNTTIEEVILPITIDFIGTNVFEGCTSLKKIELPKELKYIGANSFLNCTSLEEITLPENLLYITKGLFYGCTNLTNINIPKTIISIQEHAFAHCESLNDFELHEGLLYIEGYVFKGCLTLTKFKLPKSIITSELTAFLDCPNLSVNVTNKVFN